MKKAFQITVIVAFGFVFLVPQISHGQVKIGDSHEGGIVVFMFERNGEEHGLVCNKEDLGYVNWKKALMICEAYKGGGYTDWYLPSKFELDLMYTNLHLNALGGFANILYWSATEYGSSNAWGQFFDDGFQLNFSKGLSTHVRAVRAF